VTRSPRRRIAPDAVALPKPRRPAPPPEDLADPALDQSADAVDDVLPSAPLDFDDPRPLYEIPRAPSPPKAALTSGPSTTSTSGPSATSSAKHASAIKPAKEPRKPRQRQQRQRQRRIIDSKFADPVQRPTAKTITPEALSKPAPSPGGEQVMEIWSDGGHRRYELRYSVSKAGWVTVRSCSCPGFAHRGRCKHAESAQRAAQRLAAFQGAPPMQPGALDAATKKSDQAPRAEPIPSRLAPSPSPEHPASRAAPTYAPPAPNHEADPRPFWQQLLSQDDEDDRPEAPPLSRIVSAALDDARRKDLLRFIKGRFPKYRAGWVHRETCDVLHRLIDAQRRKQELLVQINLPFRHGKSEIASVNFGPFYLGHFPENRIIEASYAQSLSNKFSRQARSIMASDYYQNLFETRLSRSRKAVQEWETEQGGGFKAVGVGGGVTGHGADLIIVDDVYKGFEQADSLAYREKIEEWWKTELGTRQMPGASVLVLNTRWQEADFNAFLSAQARANGTEVIEIAYPAIAEEDEPHRRRGEALHPARYPLSKLLDWQRSMGPYRWRALGQQRPIPPGGEIFKREWWRYWTERDGGIVEPSLAVQGERQILRLAHNLDPETWDHCFDSVALSVDCTFKDTSDGSMVALLVCAKIGPNGYLLDAHWSRMGFIETAAKILEMCRLWSPDKVLIEDKANGPAIMSALSRDVAGLIPIEPHGSKEARAHACSGVVEAGNVFLPHPDDSPRNAWVAEFVRLMGGFPKIKPDDPVDAFTQWAVRELVGSFQYRVGGPLAPQDAPHDPSAPRAEWSLSGRLPGW
jgi:predicted phage terminase large subunit-like protein